MNNMCGRSMQHVGMQSNGNSYYQPAMDTTYTTTSYDHGNQQVYMDNPSNMNNTASTNRNLNQPELIPPVRSQPQIIPSGTRQNTNAVSFTPETLTNIDFLPAYLSQHIGKWIRADFLIGNSIEQRVGILNEVGASYIIIQAIEPATLVVCDLFSIKFVTIILDGDYPKLMLV